MQSLVFLCMPELRLQKLHYCSLMTTIALNDLSFWTGGSGQESQTKLVISSASTHTVNRNMHNQHRSDHESLEVTWKSTCGDSVLCSAPCGCGSKSLALPLALPLPLARMMAEDPTVTLHNSSLVTNRKIPVCVFFFKLFGHCVRAIASLLAS